MRTNNAPAKKDWTPALAPNLELVDSERAQLMRTDEDARILLFRQTYLKGLTDYEWELLNAEATARDLSIIHKEIAAIKFGSTLTIFPTIHGYYKLAAQSGRLEGMETLWSGDGVHWLEAWIFDKPPAAAKCSVWLKGKARPFVGVVTFNERKRMYQPSKWINGEKVNVGEPTLMEQWRDQPARMLGKCAEAAALRMSGLVGSIEPAALDFDPYDAPNAASYASVVDVDQAPAGNPRTIANANAHRAAAAIGTGDAHTIVRETVLAANPDLRSTSQASADELNAAAAIIDLAGERAPDVIDAEPGVVDPESGETEYGPEFEWAAIVDSVLSAQQSTESLAELRKAAGAEAWKWAEMIRHPRLSGNLAQKYVDLGEKACGAGNREQFLEAFQARKDARSVEGAAGERKYAEVQQAAMPRAFASDSGK